MKLKIVVKKSMTKIIYVIRECQGWYQGFVRGGRVY
jgi:hypothetical protein